MAPSIPDRWLNYKPVGEVIKGTRFIAFKVPLRQHIVESVPSDIRLDIVSIFNKIPKLGMIIDLTNTNRYYDPSAFREKGVVYEKLMIPGHDIPPETHVRKFRTLVNNFLQENANNEKLIGVHCTHGVNRTGYLISGFMISELKMSPQEAIQFFGEARGHAIERKNYLDHLMGIRTNEAPTRPHPDNFRRYNNNVSNHTSSHRYDSNSRSQMPYNNRPMDNWRAPQANSNAERSLPVNSYNSSMNDRDYTQRSSYGRDERQYNQHRSSNYRDERRDFHPSSSYSRVERSYSNKSQKQ